MTLKLTRRQVLRGALCGIPVAIGLPILEAALNSSGTAFADGEALPRRFGIFFWGNGRGVVASRWTPASTGASWAPSPQLAPLADYKKYVNVVTGARVRISKSPQGHHKGAVGILSGNDFVTQPAGNAPFRSTYATPSIDQVIAKGLNAGTPFRSLEIGISQRVIKGEGSTLQFLSHNGPDSANPPEYDPVKLFDRIFTGTQTPVPDPGLGNALIEMEKSVLDSVTADLNSLKSRVGARDRARLDQHAQNIRDIEARLKPGTVGTAPVCATPVRPGPLAQNPRGEPLVERMKAMSELVALALACDRTRVFSIMFSGGAANHVLHPIDLTRGHHELSHEGQGAQDQIDRSTIFTMEQLAVLLKALDGATEGDGTLLRQTAILASSDTSDGAAHSVNDYPVLVAGAGGGFFKSPGIHHVARDANTSTVLLSLVRAMGINATEFGGGDGRVTESCTAIEA
jgi:hypothetical protein